MAPRDHVWAIVLAGGESALLRPMMTEVFGIDVPNQYCTFNGHESLVRQAVRRAVLLTSRERVVAVVSAQHRPWWEAQLKDLPDGSLVVQPCNRGTACGVLLPLIHVVLQDPHATVVVLPSDHFVADEAAVVRTVRKAVRTVQKAPDSIVLLGIHPDGPDHEYGWIEPTLTTLGGVHWVLSFVEKPVPAVAERLRDRGALWNSCIFVAQGLTLLAAFNRAFPELVKRFGAAWLDAGNPATTDERMAVLFTGLPSLDLSRDLFEASSDSLRVVPVPPCGWTDLGTPERVLRCLERAGREGWPDASPPETPALYPDLAAGVAAYVQNPPPHRSRLGDPPVLR